jgi:N-methylhydantoinase A
MMASIPEAFGHTIHLAMRYRGQAFELDVPLVSTRLGIPLIDEALMQQSQQRFHELHQRRYGHANPARTIDIAMLRHTMTSATTALPSPVIPTRNSPCTPVQTVWAYPNDDDHAVLTAIYQRDQLVPHDLIVGPAVIYPARRHDRHP